ncbi:MAG: KEOPS complex subunit Cgi121 [Candidatus Micrarchaeota archaeon]|nr:KEOPS complex subunit Cgi121 [Candidatus Micrarchaeota archaeon]
MIYAEISAELSANEINTILKDEDALVIDFNFITSELELKLAEQLTISSFKQKNNIANKFKYEFLLWVSGKRDIKSAMEVTLPKSNKMIIVVFGTNYRKILSQLNPKVIKKKLPKIFDSIALERISTSRVF